jgi:hypothetical protein
MAYGGVDVKIRVFFTSALAGSERSASRIPGIHSIGVCGPHSQSGRHVKVKIFLFYRDTNSDPFLVQLAANRYTDCATATLR